MTNSSLLTKSESAALRGFAILGIVLHNYCHFLAFAVKENEYTFTAEKPMQMLEKLLGLDGDLFVHVFSFFGHYGVPVFLFLSGFGLVMKYEKSLSIDKSHFLSYHFLKLFRLMIIGYLAFIAVYALRHDDVSTVYSPDRVLAQLTMTVNFLYPRPDVIIKPGPYWFFGLMVQLYALYVLVIHRWRNPGVLAALVAVAFFLQYLYLDSFNSLNFIRYNFIGGLLPFCMGVAFARHGHPLGRMSCLMLLLLSALCILFGSLNGLSWLWVPLFIVTGAVATVRLIPASWLKPWAWLGGVSSALFVMHPLAREIVIPHYRHTDLYFGILIYLCTSIALALLLQYVLKTWIPQPKNLTSTQSVVPSNSFSGESVCANDSSSLEKSFSAVGSSPLEKSINAAESSLQGGAGRGLPGEGASWYDLSRYRAPLMGLAILVVILFHVPVARSSAWYGLARLGNNGVDMFLFLSGMGLWFAWTKHAEPPSLASFYKRRLLRIYPVWLVVACLYYIPTFLNGEGGRFTPDVLNLVLNILCGWSFWRVAELTFWYVPAIMMMYLLAPFYMRLLQKNPAWRWLPLVFILAYAVIRYVAPVWQTVGYLEIFWSRLPVFMLGVNAGEWVRTRRPFCAKGLSPSPFWLLCTLSWALSLWVCYTIEAARHSAFPPFVERMVYIPLAVTTMLLASQMFRRAGQVCLRLLTFVGGISLELYLIHLGFVLPWLRPLHLGYFATTFLLLLISIPLSWLLSKLNKIVCQYINL